MLDQSFIPPKFPATSAIVSGPGVAVPRYPHNPHRADRLSRIQRDGELSGVCDDLQNSNEGACGRRHRCETATHDPVRSLSPVDRQERSVEGHRAGRRRSVFRTQQENADQDPLLADEIGVVPASSARGPERGPKLPYSGLTRRES